MAQIFDSFFILSTPPRGEEAPVALDLGPICSEAARAAGYTEEVATGRVVAHDARIRQALRLFFDGASRILKSDHRQMRVSRNDSAFTIVVTGQPEAADFELTKIFKFYYTDPGGEPDLSLPTARLIVETYGGELNASQESDKVHLRLSLPLGEE